MARATPSPALPSPWPTAWEYQDISLEYDGSWAAALDKLGREGWRVVVAIHDESVAGDKELRVLLERPRAVSAAVTEGRVTKRKSKTADTGHETVVEDDDSDEDAP